LGSRTFRGNVPAFRASNAVMANPIPNAAKTETSDAALIERALARDAVALAEIMRHNNRRLYRAAWGILRDEQEAEDAVQDCYLKAFAALPKFRGEASLSTWLTRIAINEALMRRRKRQAQAAAVGNVIPLRPDESPAAEAVEDPARSPESAAMRAQLRPYLEDAVGGLPEDQRAVFVLRAMEELSVEETADCLSISRRAIYSNSVAHAATAWSQRSSGASTRSPPENNPAETPAALATLAPLRA